MGRGGSREGGRPVIPTAPPVSADPTRRLGGRGRGVGDHRPVAVARRGGTDCQPVGGQRSTSQDREGGSYVTRTHTRKVGAARPPTAADSGQGEGAQALKGRSARSLMTGGGRGCRPGGGGVSNPAVRTGGEGWGGMGPYRTRTDLDRVKGQGAGGWCLTT